MVENRIKKWIEAEFAALPERSSGPYQNSFVVTQIELALKREPDIRPELVAAFREWILERSPAATLTAVAMVSELGTRLAELEDDLEMLKIDIEMGKCFFAYDVPLVELALEHIRGE